VELAVTPGELVMVHYSGRMGNHIQSVTMAIMIAQELGYGYVRLPNQTRHSIEILDLPQRLLVKPRNDKTTFSCAPSGALPPYLACHGANKGEFRRIMTDHLWPMLTRAAQVSCAREAWFTGLTVHLRSGDLLDSQHFQAKFAPCSFFDRVIHRFRYQAVRIITEPDRKHPCIAELALRHPDVNISVQSKSVVEDYCALMTAQDLAVGSFSTFSGTAEMWNDQLKNLFLPGACSCDDVTRPQFAVRSWCYQVEGIETQGFRR